MLRNPMCNAAQQRFALRVLLRASREEQALAAEFGEEWQAYAARVPMLFPRWKIKSRENDK